MQEQEILHTGLHGFMLHTGLQAKELTAEKLRKLHGKKNQPDGAVDIVVKNKSHLFLIEIKNELREIHLPRIISRLAPVAEKWLLVCQYISKPNREILKQQRINYLDASGNCHIHQGSLLLYVNDRSVTPQRQPDSGKIWKPAGLRLVFTLLNKPGLINEPYRSIAAESRNALGTIGALLKELETEGFIKTTNKHSSIEKRENLLNRWTENFCSTLRPKLLQGRFRFATPAKREQWKKIKLNKAWWSGEPAGAILTGHLHPEKFTLYSDLPKTELIKQFQLMPDANGELELLRPFWNTEAIPADHEDCVPTLLVYAELNTSFDSRNRDTATRLKKQFHV
jgi:hypothetical protein